MPSFTFKTDANFTFVFPWNSKEKKKLANAESLSSNALGWIVLDQIFELDLVLIMVLGLK